MSIKEIKERLHESIENIDDNEFLITIKELIEHKYQSFDTPKLTKWQLKRIEESEEQINKGNYFTDKEVDKVIDRWLKE